jgi:hypothetical protein
MNPIAFDEENALLDSPRGIPLDQCEPLPVYIGKEKEHDVIISCFKLTREELDEVNRTGRVWLVVRGRIMPMVALDGISPFEVTK